eukprot:6194053-Pleurochrysis_carterae.AAC.2
MAIAEVGTQSTLNGKQGSVGMLVFFFRTMPQIMAWRGGEIAVDIMFERADRYTRRKRRCLENVTGGEREDEAKQTAFASLS